MRTQGVAQLFGMCALWVAFVWRGQWRKSRRVEKTEQRKVRADDKEMD